jgi:hypothetical protein
MQTGRAGFEPATTRFKVSRTANCAIALSSGAYFPVNKSDLLDTWRGELPYLPASSFYCVPQTSGSGGHN